ncbi:unnamed protein product [Hyaloperonospora brassicae]|uniref:PAP-associated domain-containing protein n=1 Tax=Hyaloperonospora brassicae TaxID=162125 RepID=A0AAV0UEK3_HYABA|nr:unnamed protein product [Hyaloperonospora brassicae]
MPAPPRERQKRRGRRKSKTERLARSSDVGVSSANLLTLLRAKSSHEWDAAQSVAQQIDTLEARATVVRVLLAEQEAPRAAAHYAKRLNLRDEELLAAVTSHSTAISPLLMAQFLVEVEEDALSTSERLQRFVWPWVLQSMARSEQHKTALKAAVHLMLHPTASDDAKMHDKRERGRRLQRALVTKCLQTGKVLHLVPVHAKAFADQIDVRSTAGADGEEENECRSADRENEKELRLRQQLACRVQDCLRLMWPDARVEVFGSSVTGLLPTTGQAPADVDLCALLPSAPQFRQETAELVTEAKDHLSLYLLRDLTDGTDHSASAVTGARIPIVRFRDPSTALPCDLCVNNVPALWNTRLVRWLLYSDAGVHSPDRRRQLQHARQLCRWLRKWRQTKLRVIGSAVSSYGLTLLALYYLQRAGVLPVLDCSSHVVEDGLSLRTLTEDEIDKRLEAVDKTFIDTGEPANKVRDMLALRRGFFRFYTCDFDYEHTVVSLRTVDVMAKTGKGWSRQNDVRLCLEDPVETERDLGMLCSRRALGRLRCAFAHACVVLSKKDDTKGIASVLPIAQQDVEAYLLTSWAYEEENACEAEDAEGTASS